MDPNILKKAVEEDSGAEWAVGYDAQPLLSVFKHFAGPSLWSGSAVAKAEVNSRALEDNLDVLWMQHKREYLFSLFTLKEEKDYFWLAFSSGIL